MGDFFYKRESEFCLALVVLVLSFLLSIFHPPLPISTFFWSFLAFYPLYFAYFDVGYLLSYWLHSASVLTVSDTAFFH